MRLTLPEPHLFWLANILCLVTDEAADLLRPTMRLIHTKTLELVEFFGDAIPEYAILSHTWAHDEVTFKDWKRLEAARKKAGFSKIEMACRQALKDCHDYLWVDTNCIDKRSSAELSEAINSMFSWYKNAATCYAYLADVERAPPVQSTIYDDHFCGSRWFTRGWTLQELLAPREMVFYAKDWSRIGTRSGMAGEISEATEIPAAYMWGSPLAQASVAQKMSWISKRETTRIEDVAYCMLGIFDINMPLLYGEGPKAFTRLQEEIIRTSTDHTIFCWSWSEKVPEGWGSLLAPFPQAFRNSGGYIRATNNLFDAKAFTMTNAGLKIDLPILQAFSYRFGVLNATHTANGPRLICVPIQGCMDASHTEARRRIMQRHFFPAEPLLLDPSWAVCQFPLYIRPYTYPGPGVGIYPRPQTPGYSSHSYLLLLDVHKPPSDDQSSVLRDLYGPYCNHFVRMERTQQLVGVQIFPYEKFDQVNGLITLADSSTPDGVVIGLGNYETFYVIFLGVKPSPDGTGLRRFCGVISRQSSLASYRLGPEDLKVLVDLMVEERVDWIRGSDGVDRHIAGDIMVCFGEQVECDDGCLFPILITYEDRSPMMRNFQDEQGEKTLVAATPAQRSL